MIKISFYLILSVLSLIYIKNSYQECLCNVKSNGEYCGTELNEINGNTDCGRNMYFCGNTNRNGTAVVLVTCPEGRECDVKIRGRNACLRRIHCRCDRSLTRRSRGPYCGNQLNGRDCGPNVTFMCRMIGSPNPVDSCPGGCSEGKCISSSSEIEKPVNKSEVERESDTSASETGDSEDDP